MEDSKRTEKLIIEIPEMSLDYNDKNWTENIKAEFDKFQSTFAPGKENYSYYTWFWFFLKYGDFLFTEEAQQKISEAGNIFNFIKENLGISTSGGGAYPIGYNFFNSFLKGKDNFEVCGIKFRRSNSEFSHKKYLKIA